MFYIHLIILYCLNKINGERTCYSILHILNGKRSSQTIQDIHMFQLKELFFTFPTLQRNEFDSHIKSLVDEDWLDKIGEHRWIVKKEKISNLEALFLQRPFPLYLKGWSYHQLTISFWQRLVLSVQVASHLSVNSTRYIPVQQNREVQEWLKKTLTADDLDRKTLNHVLFKELVSCLEGIAINPNVLICRFSGKDMIGKTKEQAAEFLQMDRDHYHLSFIAVIHYMIDKVKKDPTNFPLLTRLIENQEKTYTLTASTEKTFYYVQKGLSLQEISMVRQLKLGTIEDHIVEIILNVPTFPTLPYISNEKFQRIAFYIKEHSFKSLKRIKEVVEDATYFEIRVVLARLGEKR